MEGLVKKRVEIHVEIQDMEIFQDMKIIQNMEISLDMEIFLDIETKYHTLLYRTTIGRRKMYILKYIIYTLTHFINSC